MAIKISLPLVVLAAASVLAAPQNRFFDSAGVQIHYLEEGAGQTVVLLHGFTSSAESWVRNGMFAELAKRYHVIALDVRGHGQSGKPHSADQYGREMGRDVMRLLDARGIKRAHIIGYSLGAQIVAQLVASSPERFTPRRWEVHQGAGPGRQTMIGWPVSRQPRWNRECCALNCSAWALGMDQP